MNTDPASLDRHLEHLFKIIDNMQDVEHGQRVRLGDRTDGAVYKTTPEIETALKVALVTSRPILILGPSGCGKSSLARYVARNLQFDFLSYTVTEASEPSDLLWRVNQVQRLNDAQIQKLKGLENYIEEGILWQAFDPIKLRSSLNSNDHSNNEQGDDFSGTVVLIDELDKADASFANSLLVPIGSSQFEVPILNKAVKVRDNHVVLVLFTSNGERSLPPAFLRRCICLQIDLPSAEDLVDITRRHWREWMLEEGFAQQIKQLATRLANREMQPGHGVSTAEFLDVVQVLRRFAQDQTIDQHLVEKLLLRRPVKGYT